MSGLRTAAAALLAEAPEAIVQIILRMLVDSLTPVPAQPPQPAPSPTPRAASPPRQPASAAQPVVDAAWDELRGRVKAAMAERGASYADVATAIRRSEIGTRIAVGSRKPPPLLVRVRLQEWLAEAPTDAPAVAAHAATFPGNGASRVHTGSLGTAD